MKRSTDRILTSHAGSLARPLDLLEMMRDRSQRPARTTRTPSTHAPRSAVARDRQAAGRMRAIDIPSDGELSKPMFADYIVDRLSGFEGENPLGAPFVRGDNLPEPFPAYAAWRAQTPTSRPWACARSGRSASRRWPGRTAPTRATSPTSRPRWPPPALQEAFLPSPSPGIIVMRIPNQYYKTEEEYLFAVADVLRDEYKAIVDAGLVLQIDAPDAAMSWDRQHWADLAEFRKALSSAHRGAEPRPRRHPGGIGCASTSAGATASRPTSATSSCKIVDLILQVKAACYTVEAANPRHAHEWTVWQDVKLPDGKALMPGVIDSLTMFVEHPELVAQRIVHYASIVGRENVIAGTDCGFGTGATANPRVHPEIVMAKFRALSEGARLASRELW